MDERGYLYLVDRSSDMIVTGGYNVYPREVEDALMVHPAVAECAVVGAPDATWVEAVTAFVSLRPGAEAGEDELRTPYGPGWPATRCPRPSTSSTACRSRRSARSCAARCATRCGSSGERPGVGPGRARRPGDHRILDQPQRRNAVDGPMAAELTEAFAAFDADPDAAVAVLYGDGGHFCSGADLKAVGTERGNPAGRTATVRWARPGCGSPSR